MVSAFYTTDIDWSSALSCHPRIMTDNTDNNSVCLLKTTAVYDSIDTIQGKICLVCERHWLCRCAEKTKKWT